MGVGLFYHQGYFEQKLNQDGWQQEHYPESEIENLPMRRARDAQGEPIRIFVPFPDGECQCRVWNLAVGSISLILIDANMAENPPHYRELTARLYGGDHFMRLRQELLLAVGGFRALVAKGIVPDVCHMNEGHAAFLSVARMEYLTKELGLNFDSALEVVRRSNVFTTHTPVAAGNETFAIDLVREHLQALEGQTGVAPEHVLSWGRAPGDHDGPLSMTILGLSMAHRSNGVSALHGDVARRMWQHVWPHHTCDEVPIRHVTNGVHARTWLAPEITDLLDRHAGRDWEKASATAEWPDRIAALPDAELWQAHGQSHARLITTARERLRHQLTTRNATRAELNLAKEALDPNVLTIAFARRAASYKRATLLLRDRERLERLIKNADRPVQFIFAGKAHPADDHGKDFIRQLVAFSREGGWKSRFLFLENYDMRLARALVQGGHVWLNTPRRRVEASGTSGMKAAMNGVLNASILDGWWCEGYAPDCGWAIGNGEEYEDDDYGDQIESAALYKILEDDIIPCFYKRPQGAHPTEWVQMMKASLRMSLGFFSTRRMVCEYRDKFYIGASRDYRALLADHGRTARDLVLKRHLLDSHWKSVQVKPPQTAEGSFSGLHAGDSVTLRSSVFLGSLAPGDVTIQLCSGPADNGALIKVADFTPMVLEKSHGDGWHDYVHHMALPGAGRFGITARAVPADLTWLADSPSYMTWAG
jgi:glycogen phosphorylase